MIINLLEIPVYWINLDSQVRNAEKMNELFLKFGFKNTSRKSGRIIDADPKTIYNKHYAGCAQSHIDVLESHNLTMPFLVLEDDVDILNNNFNPIIEVPEDTDAVYLGISIWTENHYCKQYTENFRKISGIFSSHAILYITEQYKNKSIEVIRKSSFQDRIPFDVGLSNMQKDFCVLTPNSPFFYQSDDRNSSNKNEYVTKSQLSLTE